MNKIIANVHADEPSPLPIVFRNLCEHHPQEHVRWTRGMPFHQILLIAEGRGELRYGDERYELTRGCAFYTSPGHPVEYIDLGGLLSIFVTATGAAANMLADGFAPGGLLFRSDTDIEHYAALIRGIRHEYEHGCGEGRLSSLTYSFFVDFLSKRKSADPEHIRFAVKYIDKNFSEKITLEALAKNSCVSVSKLSHDFKRVYGVSVFEYIMDVRLRYARNILTGSGGVMTKDAASISGFRDVGYFCRAYKRKFGVSPGEERGR